MHLLSQSKNFISALELKRHLGVCYKTASLVRPLTAVSDGLVCFLATEDAGVHERHVTGGGKAASKLPQFREVNTVLSNLETWLSGTFHVFKFAKYAHRYLAEFQYRFNRRFDLRSILIRLVAAACTTKPHGLANIRG